MRLLKIDIKIHKKKHVNDWKLDSENFRKYLNLSLLENDDKSIINNYCE